MSDNRNNYTPAPLTALNEIRLRLVAEPVSGSKRKPTLRVKLRKNNIDLEVYTNVEGDRDNGRAVAPMSSPEFFMFVATLKKIIASKEPKRIIISNKDYVYVDRKRSDTPKLVSNTIIEKEADGSIYIAVLNNVVTPVKFYFLPSEYHDILGPDNKQIPKAELCALVAEGWANLMANLTPIILADNFSEPPPYNKPNNYPDSKPSGKTTEVTFDDDLTF